MIDKTLQDKGADSLAGMLPGSDENSFFIFEGIGPYSDCWNDIIRKSMA